jgi:hypothetical protein
VDEAPGWLWISMISSSGPWANSRLTGTI